MRSSMSSNLSYISPMANSVLTTRTSMEDNMSLELAFFTFPRVSWSWVGLTTLDPVAIACRKPGWTVLWYHLSQSKNLSHKPCDLRLKNSSLCMPKSTSILPTQENSQAKLALLMKEPRTQKDRGMLESLYWNSILKWFTSEGKASLYRKSSLTWTAKIKSIVQS